MKSLGPENIFSSPSAIKAQKLTAVCLFKFGSVLNKNNKKEISAQIWEL